MAKPPFGVRLTLSDRFYTPTLIRPDNERDGWGMSQQMSCGAAPLANAQTCSHASSSVIGSN